jgi:hypothetical protein
MARSAAPGGGFLVAGASGHGIWRKIAHRARETGAVRLGAANPGASDRSDAIRAVAFADQSVQK